MLIILAQATPPPEPAPQGWHATGEAVLRHAESRPDIFWPLLTVAVAVGIPVLLVLAFVRWGLPFLREEAQKNRDNLAAALRDRAREALEDSAAARELGRVEKEALVNRVESKLDRVTGELQRVGERVERHSEVLARLAAKAGVGLALLVAFLGGLAAGAGAFALAERPAVYAPVQPAQQVQAQPAADDDTARGECVKKPCPRGWRCCGPERCCEIRESTASSPPLSSLQLARLDNVAEAECQPEVDWCL